MRPLATLLVVVGCQSNGIMAMDASPDTGGSPDSGPLPGRGVEVSWRAEPPIPGAVNAGIMLSAASFQVSHLRVVSDAGPDARTTRSRYLVSWSAAGAPEVERFPQAPIGVYSNITVDAAVGNLAPYAYQIEGTWRERPGDPAQPFRIIDYQSLSTTIDCEATLTAGGLATLTIQLELEDALDDIDFEDLRPDEDGVLVLVIRDLPNPLAREFRDKLRRAFKNDYASATRSSKAL